MLAEDFCVSIETQGTKCLQGFLVRCLRIILRVSVRDCERNNHPQKGQDAALVHFAPPAKTPFPWASCPNGRQTFAKQLLVCTLPEMRRRAGGQKLRWNDLVSRDLQKCGLSDVWRNLARDSEVWQHAVIECTARVNEEDELKEKQAKDEKRKRRENGQIAEESALHCDEPECTFTALTRAGLVNHRHQAHAQPHFDSCTHCGRLFHRQGLHNHQRFCSSRQRNNNNNN